MDWFDRSKMVIELLEKHFPKPIKRLDVHKYILKKYKIRCLGELSEEQIDTISKNLDKNKRIG